jgi:hypothetical protein
MEMRFYSYLQNPFQLNDIAEIFKLWTALILAMRRRSETSHKINQHILAETRKIDNY